MKDHEIVEHFNNLAVVDLVDMHMAILAFREALDETTTLKEAMQYVENALTHKGVEVQLTENSEDDDDET